MFGLRLAGILAGPKTALARALSLVADEWHGGHAAGGASTPAADHGRRPGGARCRAGVAPDSDRVRGLAFYAGVWYARGRGTRAQVSRSTDHRRGSRDDSEAPQDNARSQPPRVVLGALRPVAVAATERSALRCDLPRPAAVVASWGPHRAPATAMDDAQAVAAAHECATGPDRHHVDRHVAARAGIGDVPSGAPHAGRRPLQQSAGAASLSRVPTTRRRASEVSRGCRRSPGGLLRVGIGPGRAWSTRSLHRLERRGPAPKPSTARLQSAVSDPAMGTRAAFGVAPARPDGGAALTRLAADLRAPPLLAGNLHRSDPLSWHLLSRRKLDSAGPHDGPRAPRPDEAADPSDQRGARLSADAGLSRPAHRRLTWRHPSRHWTSRWMIFGASSNGRRRRRSPTRNTRR